MAAVATRAAAPGRGINFRYCSRKYSRLAVYHPRRIETSLFFFDSTSPGVRASLRGSHFLYIDPQGRTCILETRIYKLMFETCKIKKTFKLICIILIQFNYIDYKINMTEKYKMSFVIIHKLHLKVSNFCVTLVFFFLVTTNFIIYLSSSLHLRNVLFYITFFGINFFIARF